MTENNDEQDSAIFDAISKQHKRLNEMYAEEKNLQKKQKKELNDFRNDVTKQEHKVEDLCKGLIKTYFDSNDKLILDTTGT